jgi:4-azaleucine resistance transporter AzlC
LGGPGEIPGLSRYGAPMEPATRRQSVLAGARAGVPFGVAAVLLGASFGVLAQPVMGTVATIVMSAVVFAGAAQFAALAVLAAGGGVLAAVVAGVLMNTRFIPMGVAIAPWMRGSRLTRALKGQTLVDVSWAMASRGEGRFDADFMLGATIPQYPGWVGGTVLGALAGSSIGDPTALGVDALFPAFFLSLLAAEVSSRRQLVAALLGAAIALCLIPLTPAGVPIIAASMAALLGLARR